MASDYDAFDDDIIMHINTVFLTLEQVGIGPDEGFSIRDNTKTWQDYIPTGNYEAVKTYIYLSVRLIFDPPGTGYLIEAMERQKKEILWRLRLQKEGVD